MNPRKELRRQLEKCIEPSVDSWFSMLKATVMPTRGVRNEEIIKLANNDKIFLLQSEPKELRDLCVYCLTWSERVVEKLILNDTFTRYSTE